MENKSGARASLPCLDGIAGIVVGGFVLDGTRAHSYHFSQKGLCVSCAISSSLRKVKP